MYGLPSAKEAASKSFKYEPRSEKGLTNGKGLEMCRLKVGTAACDITLFGAHVTSWREAREEYLFVSATVRSHSSLFVGPFVRHWQIC